MRPYITSCQGLKDVLEENLNPLSANPTKWSNTLKQFIGIFPTNFLSVFDHFVGLAIEKLKWKEINSSLRLHDYEYKISFVNLIIVYRKTWLGNQKILIIDLIVNIILDYLKKTVHNAFTITTNIQGGVL